MGKEHPVRFQQAQSQKRLFGCRRVRCKLLRRPSHNSSGCPNSVPYEQHSVVVQQADMSCRMARRLHDLKTTDPVTFHERAHRHRGTNLGNVRRSGPDRGQGAPFHDFAEAADMVRMPMGEDDVRDVTPCCSDTVQGRRNRIHASFRARIDQQQPRRVRHKETTYVHRQLNRPCQPGGDVEVLDDRFYLHLRATHHAPFQRLIMTPYWSTRRPSQGVLPVRMPGT